VARVVILGTAYSVAAEEHQNTHFAVIGRERQVLVDCTGTPNVRLKRAGMEINNLTDLILTHFHPDHVSGAPLLLMQMWLLGRSRPLNIYGLAPVMDRMETLMGFYDWATWPNFFPVTFNRLPSEEMTPVLSCDEMVIHASPVQHMIPTIGLRFDFDDGRSLAYSCDTAPCGEVVRLAKDADVLIHEASGGPIGHSTAREAGEIAARAGAHALYLIHYPTINPDYTAMLLEASQAFNGPVKLAQDYMTFGF